MPLPDAQAREEDFDEALMRRALPDGLADGLAGFARQNGLELSALYETAAMLLLAKYSGGTDALCAVVREGERCPVYCDFEKEGSLIGCCSAVKAQADGAVQHGAAGFDTVCAELGLSPMPVLTDDEIFFNAFSLNGAGPQTALCLFFDVRTGVVCARYNAAHYGEDMAGRLLDSLAVVLGAVARERDGGDAPC